MNCDGCNAPADIVETRHAPGAVRRRRVCSSCGARFNTYEIPEHLFAMLRDAASLRALADQVRLHAATIIDVIDHDLPSTLKRIDR